MTAKVWQRWGAWIYWLLLFSVVMYDVARRPAQHTTMKTYRDAATQWWAGQDPYSYNAHAGFFYFPQAAVVFTPFNLMSFGLGEVLWRVATFGLFFHALGRLSRFFPGRNGIATEKTFLILSLLAVPCSLASLRNAQFDLPLAALVVLTAAEVAASRWNAATVWICLGIALKPLAVVPLLLFGALYWRLIPRLAVGLLVVIFLPFLHWNPVFVAHEYVRCFEALAWASKGDEPRYSDLAALLSMRLGYEPSHEFKTVVRVIFAGIYFGLAWLGVRRLRQIEAAWLVGALSADYLMLFNPRTETCSYVFLGPFVASLTLFYAIQPRRKALAWFLGFCALGLACDAIPKVGNFSIHLMTDRWFKPLIALVFLSILIHFIFGKRRDDANVPAVPM